MKIGKNDLVLEIGSGDRPYPRSDVLCDRFIGKTPHRDPGSKIILDRLMVIADGEKLPFKNKGFDYIIASHVLEHVEHPNRFLDEIQRVGKRGYLAFPKLPLERFYKNAPHRWYCIWDGGSLTLVRKTKKSIRKWPTKDEDKLFILAMRYFPEKFHASFEWSKKIQYKIVESEPEGFLEKIDQEIKTLMDKAKKINALPSPFFQIKDKLFAIKLRTTSTLERFYWRSKRKVDLFPLLCCPHCHGSLLKISPKVLGCQKCLRKYKFLQNGIPELL